MSIRHSFRTRLLWCTVFVLASCSANLAPASATGTGSISGFVVADGKPVAGACVQLSMNNKTIATTSSTHLGSYEFDGLSAGLYTVQTCLTSASPYTNAIIPNAIQVVQGKASRDENLRLSLAGSISGTVTDAVTNAPVAGVCLTAYLTSDQYDGSPTATTSNDGSYTFTNLATGSYRIATCLSSASSYANTTLDESVSAPTEISGANIALAQGGSISGTVTDSTTGAPLGDIYVFVSLKSGGTFYQYSSYTTSSNGTYTVSNLPPGTYTVGGSSQVAASGTDYTFVTPTSAVVQADSTTSGVNFSGVADGSITGRVTDATSGRPLDHICVSAKRTTGENLYPSYPATTSANGTYVLVALYPGTYLVSICAAPGHVLKRLTSPIAVEGGTTTGRVNLSLQRI